MPKKPTKTKVPVKTRRPDVVFAGASGEAQPRLVIDLLVDGLKCEVSLDSDQIDDLEWAIQDAKSF